MGKNRKKEKRKDGRTDSGNTGIRLRRSVIYNGINFIHCLTQ